MSTPLNHFGIRKFFVGPTELSSVPVVPIHMYNPSKRSLPDDSINSNAKNDLENVFEKNIHTAVVIETSNFFII
jgi:hypothetical protein